MLWPRNVTSEGRQALPRPGNRPEGDNRGVRGRRGLGKSSSQCKGPGVRGIWPLSEHLKEGQCGWRVKHPQRSREGVGVCV